MPYDPRRYVPDYSYKARAAQQFGDAAVGLAKGIGSAVQAHRELEQEEKTAQGLKEQFTGWLSKLKTEVLADMGIDNPQTDVPDPSGMRLEDYKKALTQWFKPKRNTISSLTSDPETLQNLIKGSPVNIEKEVGAAKQFYRKEAIDNFLQQISETQPGSQDAAQMAREAQISDDPNVTEAIGRIRGREQVEGMGEAQTTEEAVRGGIGATMTGGQAYGLEDAAGQYSKTYGTKQQQAAVSATNAIADKRRRAGVGGDQTKPSEEHLYAVRKQINTTIDNISQFEGRIKGVEEQMARRKEIEKQLSKEDLGFAEKGQLQEELAKLGKMEELAATKKRIKTMQDREKSRLGRYEKQEEVMIENAETRAERTAAEANRRQEIEERLEFLKDVIKQYGPRGTTGVDVDPGTVMNIKKSTDIPEDIKDIVTTGLFNNTIEGDGESPIVNQNGTPMVDLNNEVIIKALSEGYTIEEIIQEAISMVSKEEDEQVAIGQ